jgi:hypothetical protein
MSADDLWVITCYFNPCRYKTKRANFDAFMEGMKKDGANVLVVELAFADEEYELPEGDNVLRLRGSGVMWQKERLLNVAAKSLPESCTKVAWLDNDVLFENSDWVAETSAALDKYMVVQPFDWCVRLPQGVRKFDGRGETYESYASVYARAPRLAQSGEFVHHGHTGFAWAARRELFDHCGLYDACLTGSGDHLMSHGFSGGMRRSPCMKRVIGNQATYLRHYLRWADKTRELVQGRLGYIPGTLLHLWHGDLADRRYTDMNNQFMTFDFDPDRHLALDENKLFVWSDEAPQRLQDWADKFFWIRREDGIEADSAQKVAVSA